MNLTSCPSRPKIASPCSEILRNRDMNILLSTTVTKGLDFNKKNSRFVVCKHHDAEKFVLSGHFQGSCVGNKQSQEPNRKLKFVRTLLIDNYDSYTFNIFQELSVVNGVPPVVIRNDEWTWEDICFYLYEEKAFDNIVISPGPGSPACPADIGICLRLLLECRDIPILGVCLGHQALGYVHGGRVVHASEAIHGRLSEIEHNGCSLFYEIPTGKGSGFKVVRYHSLVLDAESLPKELVPIAWTVSSQTLPFFGTPKPDPLDAYESQTSQQICVESLSTRFANRSSWLSCGSEGIRNRKVLMGIMHSTRPHYGLQFHPESVASCFGRQIFKNFREMTKDYWIKLTSLSTCEKEVHYAVSMQVPRVCQLFREVPGRMPLLNKSDKRNHFNLSSTTNIPCSRDGVKFFKLRWRKLDSLVSRVGGARNIFCILFGDHEAGNSFWLDSSSTEKRRARFSFMGGKGGSLWKQLTFRLSYQSDIKFKGGGYLSVEDAEGSTKSMYLEEGFFDYLNKELQSFRFDKKDCEGLPFDFCSGYVGYIGYDLKIECGMPANCHKSRAPDACFFFADNLVVIDHLCDDVYVLSLHDESTGMTHWLEDVERKLHNVKAGSMEELMYQMSKQNNNEPLKQDFLAEKSKERYIKDIEKCQKFIKDGESYELCLTTQMRNKIGEINYLGLYLKLREKNPAPYAAWLNFSKENLCICCSSPERFLRLDRYGTLEAKPIKGTIARSVTEEEDKLLKLQLQYSEKDQAENLMIVDLLRNDLGRVCEPGSVHVPHLMEVESYATVHTMVSTIRGKKRANVSAVDCVRAAFPGGSMTGAPKLRSMEILDSLESCSRGIYSGCIGFFSYNQTFDLNIVIRTIVIHKGEASIGAGGAIVSLSNPEDEYKEMILKTRAPVDAVKEYQRGLQFES